MNYTAEQIQSNFETFIGYLETHIEGSRKNQLIEFYTTHAERFALMPASSKASYHNAFPGGYIDHVNRVIECALRIREVWISMGTKIDFTTEELVFAAANHDLGKLGDLTQDNYLPSQDQWRKDKLGELYTHNPNLDFMTIPDRSLFLLQQVGIPVSLNETIAIRCHDGLYDEANKQYFISYNPDARFKTVMPLILHQADLMAANIEWQNWKFNQSSQTSKPKFQIQSNATPEGRKQNQANVKTQALGKLQTPGLKNLMSDFFND